MKRSRLCSISCGFSFKISVASETSKEESLGLCAFQFISSVFVWIRNFLSRLNLSATSSASSYLEILVAPARWITPVICLVATSINILDRFGKDLLRTFELIEDRNYRKEYDNYHANPKQRERNAARLRARRLMVKRGKVKVFDKKDVHHKDNDPTNNDLSNLSVTTQKYNRTEPRLRDEAAPTNATGAAIVGTSGTPGEVAMRLFKTKKKKRKIGIVIKKKKDDEEDEVKEDVDTLNVVPDTITPDSTFASMPVFKVNSADFAKCKFGKSKFARWAKHIDTNSKMGKRIYNYAKNNPKKSIIVQHEKSGHMLYLRKYSKSDGSKSGIMVKKKEK